MRVQVAGIGLTAPGLQGWHSAIPVLTGQSSCVASPLTLSAPSVCPPNERRRMTPVIRIALHAALEAVGERAGDIPTVFASSQGDLQVIDNLCAALAEPHRPVSPTQFHNSVHNAPAGYWHLGRGSHAASTSLSAGEASFAAGLMEAMAMVHAEASPVLLVAYDGATPERLRPLCPVDQPFACALLLLPESADGLPRLEMAAIAAEPASGLAAVDQGLEALRLANPSARALPLLRALATGQGGLIHLPYLDGTSVPVGVLP